MMASFFAHSRREEQGREGQQHKGKDPEVSEQEDINEIPAIVGAEPLPGVFVNGKATAAESGGVRASVCDGDGCASLTFP